MSKAIKRRRVGMRTSPRPVGEALEPRLLLAAGDSDPTFGGGNGAATAGFTGPWAYVQDFATAMAVRPDGKVIVAGRSGDGSNTTDNPAVARFTADGALDATFDGDGTPDGKVSYSIGADTDVAAVALQPDGKIVLAGETRYQAGNTWDWFVMRLNENGSLDTTFGGGDGFFTLDYGRGFGDDANAVAIQGDGKIVVAGNGSGMRTIRLNTDGTLDPTFGAGGISDVAFFGTSGASSASDVIIDPDGKIVVAGRASTTSTANYQLVLLRYLSNGALDTTFDGDGKVSTSFGTQWGAGKQVLRQPDGKYVVGGIVGTPTVLTGSYAVARYNANGKIDTTFGTNAAVPGTALVPSVQGHVAESYGIARQADGKLLFGGYSKVDRYPSYPQYFTAVRFTDAGAPDATFGSGGVVQASVPGSYAPSNPGADLALAPDGNILVAGATSMSGQVDFGLVKLRATADVGGVTAGGGVLTVTGTDAADTLDLSATSTTFTAVLNGVTYTFPAGSVTSINVDLKAGDDVENHNGNVPGGTVKLGDGNDALTVGTGNRPSPVLDVFGGAGDDTVILGVAFFTPTNFVGDVGDDTLIYNGSQGDDDLIVTYLDITNGGYDRATYGTVESVRVMGNFGYDRLRLASVNADTSYELDGGAGDDQILAHNDTLPDNFSSFSPVTLIGGTDADLITFDDSGDAYSDTYTITPTTFTRTGLGTFAYQSAEALRVIAGSGGSPINVTPSGATSIAVDGGPNPGSPVDRLTVSLTGATGTAFTPLGFGAGRYTFTNRQPVEFANVETDLTAFPPTVASAFFTYATRHSLTFAFSEDVTASVSPTDLVVTNLTTGQTVPTGNFTLSLFGGNGMPTTAQWDATSPLPDGNYVATLPAGSVADPAGNKLAADYTLGFFVLAGDANRDRAVNFADLLALAKNYNKTGATFDQGDFNYDGTVNFADLLILAKSYNKSLAAPAPVIESAAPVLAAATSSSVLKDEPAATPVFSTTRVAKPAAPKPPKSVARSAARR